MISLFVLVSLCGCSHAPARYDYSKEPDPRGSEYVIGAADLVRVNVWGQQDLSVDSRVRPDGTITLPLVGDVRAAGRTPSQVRAEITQRLATYVKAAESVTVTVAVVEAKSYSFTITGNAEHPGRYSADNYVTVLDALALAGGPNRFADSRNMVILRRDTQGGGMRRIPIDYESLRTGERLEQNVVVMAGDTILIP